MFSKIGPLELILIFAVILLVFGPAKLPQIGQAIGKGIREFREASRDIKNKLDEDVASKSESDDQTQ